MHTGSECLIIGAPKHGHLDFTYGLTQAGREALMLSDSCVMKLFEQSSRRHDRRHLQGTVRLTQAEYEDG